MDTPIYNAQRVLLEPEVSPLYSGFQKRCVVNTKMQKDLRYTQFDLDAATAIAEERAASVESGQGKEKNNNDKKSRRIHRYRVPKKQENQVGETKSDL